MKKQMKAKKLVCMGLAALLAFSPLQEMLVQAEETVTPEEVVEELPVMEEEVPGTGEVSAEDFRYTELEDGTLEITGYYGSDTEIVIPAEIDGKTVTSIGYRTFYGCSSLTSIEIPSGVTSIGYSAFSGCSSLTSIEIPSGVTSIGDGAFYGCRGLTSIELPAGIAYIGDDMFFDCSRLTSIELSSGITSIGKNAFWGCSGLMSIKLPAGITYIGKNAFTCCKGLTDIELPAELTSIKSGTFSDCSGLMNIKLPTKATSIESGAFSGCRQLINIEIPAGVTSIGRNAFSNCSSLKNIFVDEQNQNYSSADGVLFNKEKTELIRCPSGKAGTYEIPEGVIHIADDAFGLCDKLTSIKIPSGVMSIGEYAFAGCSGLTSIDIPLGVTSIGRYAFFDCSGLTGIEIPTGVTSIEYCVFSGCSGLTSIEIPEGVINIWGEAFLGCSGLTSIEIPAEVTNIVSTAFDRCSKLEDIIVDGQNQNYSSKDGVLFNKEKTELIVCPIGKSGNYQVPLGVTRIGDSAFEGCGVLMNVDIPAGVISIGNRAFYNCKGLERVTIPSEVTSIGALAFEYCNHDLLTIICEKNSYAHVYAVQNRISYQFIDNLQNYTIIFDTNGGVELNQSSLIIKDGETLGSLPIPVRTGYIFKGWFTEKTGGVAITEDTRATSNMTIYAHWEEIKRETENSQDGQYLKKSIEKATVTLTATYYLYDTKAKKPAVSVSLNGKTLTAGTDYSVTYKNNTNIGTASVIITGKGNYTGTVTKTFTISAKKGKTFTVGAYKYKITNASEVAFAGLKSAKTTKVVIPKTVKIGGKTFKVTSVAAKALYKKTKVTSVTIGANVKMIGASAFQNCKKLTTVTIKSSKLKSIGKNTFKGIKATAKIKVPSKKLNVYKKLLKNKGLNGKAKIGK